MSGEYEYTKEFGGFASSVIDEILFNENDSTVMLDVDDWIYLYRGVSASDVADLVAGDALHGSVGVYYNTVFKQKFGPAEKLGHYTDFEAVLVPVNKDQSVATTPKGLTVDAGSTTTAGGMRIVNVNNYETPPETLSFAVDPSEVVSIPRTEAHGGTREYNLNRFDAPAAETPVAAADEPTKEYSLNLPDLSVADDDDLADVTLTFVVHFTLNGYGDNRFKFVAEYAEDMDEAIDELHEYVARMGVSGKVKKVVAKFND